MRKKLNRFFMVMFGLAALFAAAESHAETIYVYDADSSGSEMVVLVGSTSYDSDGALIDYQWRVNGVFVSSGFGPIVPDIAHNYNLGSSTTTLIVRDDVQVSSTAIINVVVLPASSNMPPLANASVPGSVAEWHIGFASVPVNATASSDPDGDAIFRYRWTEGTTTFYDGGNAVTVLPVTGLGVHTLTLTVYSTDSLGITQSGSNNFNVTVTPLDGGLLAGRRFTRSIGMDFSFNPPNEDFAAITFNPFTQTYFLTDNKTDKLFEVQQNGSLIRTIDIGGLKRAGVLTTDAEGLTFYRGNQLAIALHDGEEVAVVNVVSTTTALTRAQALIYDIASTPKPKGITYAGGEDAFYWVGKDTPKTICKGKIVSGAMQIIYEREEDALPVLDFADVAVFPRLSPNLFIISESSKTVMEVNMTGPTAVMVSSFSLSGFDVPKAGGLMFNHNGEMLIVGKQVAGQAENDFSVFTPTSTIPNNRPFSKIKGG